MHVRHGRMYWCYVETDATAEGTLHMEEVIVGYICENDIFMITRFAGMPSPFHFSISMHDAACDSTVGTSVYC